ncbi:MAG: hypothetical protein R3B47_20680 [Bacteroidia bacterium]
MMMLIGFAYSKVVLSLVAIPVMLLGKYWRYKMYPPRLFVEENTITLVDRSTITIFTHRIRSVHYSSISDLISIGDTSNFRLEFSPSQFPDKDSYQDFMLWLLESIKDREVEYTDNLIDKFGIGQDDEEEGFEKM